MTTTNTENKSRISFAIPAAISIGYGVLSMIGTFAIFLNPKATNSENDALDFILTVFFIAISVYLLLQFKKLLNKVLLFKEADNYITFYVFSSIIGSLLVYVVDPSTSDFRKFTEKEAIVASIVGILFVVLLLIFVGSISILYGSKIKKAPSSDGMLTLYGNVAIFKGISYVSCLLSPIGLILDASSYIILGLVFLKENRILPQVSNKQDDAKSDVEKLKLKEELKKEVTEELKKEMLSQKLSTINRESISVDQKLEKMFNSLSLDEYNKIKEIATRYLPTGLKDEDVQRLIKDYIRRTYLI